MIRTTQQTDAISRQIKELIKANKGRFFSVTFTKADGKERTLTACKLIPKDKYKGENTTAHIEKYLTVECSDGVRNVNMETVKSVRMGGRSISFD